jgi:preprotein translocase subunit YajC
MDPNEITVGAMVALQSGAVGVVVHIADDDDPAIPSSAPVRVRLKDEGQLIQVAYEEIADVRPHRS